MSKQYTFTIPGHPVGKQRARTVSKYNKTFSYTPDETTNYEALVKMCATQANVQLMERVMIEIDVYLPCRLKEYKTKADAYLEPLQRPDLDNIVKSIKDALEKIAYQNDKHILELKARIIFESPNRQASVTVKLTEVSWQAYMGNQVSRWAGDLDDYGDDMKDGDGDES